MKEQALIVGGSTGMGKATAKLLLADGVETFIVGRPGDNLAAAEKELGTFG